MPAPGPAPSPDSPNAGLSSAGTGSWPGVGCPMLLVLVWMSCGGLAESCVAMHTDPIASIVHWRTKFLRQLKRFQRLSHMKHHAEPEPMARRVAMISVRG